MSEPIASAEMLIRRPVAAVFAAFIRPDMITQFWLESTTGPLAEGATLEWRFMVPGAVESVNVTTVEDQRRIVFNWSDGVSVNIAFAELPEDTTRVTVHATGFKGEQAMADVVNATEGFSIVLCELKILLETGRPGNLVKDKTELIARA